MLSAASLDSEGRDRAQRGRVGAVEGGSRGGRGVAGAAHRGAHARVNCIGRFRGPRGLGGGEGAKGQRGRGGGKGRWGGERGGRGGRARKGRGRGPRFFGWIQLAAPKPPGRHACGGRRSGVFPAQRGGLAEAGEAREGTRNEVGKSSARG